MPHPPPAFPESSQPSLRMRMSKKETTRNETVNQKTVLTCKEQFDACFHLKTSYVMSVKRSCFNNELCEN